MHVVFPVKHYKDEGFVERKIEINEEDLPVLIEEYLLAHGDFEFDEIEIVNNRPHENLASREIPQVHRQPPHRLSAVPDVEPLVRAFTKEGFIAKYVGLPAHLVSTVWCELFNEKGAIPCQQK